MILLNKFINIHDDDFKRGYLWCFRSKTQRLYVIDKNIRSFSPYSIYYARCFIKNDHIYMIYNPYSLPEYIPFEVELCGKIIFQPNYYKAYSSYMPHEQYIWIIKTYREVYHDFVKNVLKIQKND